MASQFTWKEYFVTAITLADGRKIVTIEANLKILLCKICDY